MANNGRISEHRFWSLYALPLPGAIPSDLTLRLSSLPPNGAAA